MKNWWRRYLKSRDKNAIEDALKHIHASMWQGNTLTPDSLAGALKFSPKKTMKLCLHMQRRNLVRIHNDVLKLTPEGEQLAVQVIRAHRLWERFLVDEARMPLADIHAIADRREHNRTPEEIRALDAALGYPSTDPHGDPIPTEEGTIHRHRSVPLTQWAQGQYAMIVHLEDEPISIFSQIAAIGLYPGQRIKVTVSDDDRIVFTDDRETYVLAPIVAANVHVIKSDPVGSVTRSQRLDALPLGQSATVLGLDDSLKGLTRRRLLDLGLTVGAVIKPEYRSFLGDPVAYRVRGALIALRNDQARNVVIQSNQESEGDSSE